MLSYRHGFHAGSFVDVHKHIALVLLLESLRQKDTPFCYLDTHAGAGAYDLHSEFARKHREYQAGIGRIFDRRDAPAPVAAYLDLVRTMNPAAPGQAPALRHYPGSPCIAQHFLRPGDRMILVELHNTEVPLLRRRFRGDPRVAVHHRDALEAMPALMPPKERRGLVFVDPPYELRDEFTRISKSVTGAWRKWRHGMFVLWYPVQRRQPLRAFYRALCRSGAGPILLSEFHVGPDHTPDRLAGSGLAVINPPWRFDRSLVDALRWLEPVLEQAEHPPPRLEWLVAD